MGLVVFISIIFILSSSLFFVNQSPSSDNKGIMTLPQTSGSQHSVSFSETGLPLTTKWSVTLNGTDETSTTGSTIFSVGNGTYPYSVDNVSEFSTTSTSSSIVVSGTGGTINVVFTKMAPVSISPVNLGTAANYTILAKTGISDTGTSGIVVKSSQFDRELELMR